MPLIEDLWKVRDLPSQPTLKLRLWKAENRKTDRGTERRPHYVVCTVCGRQPSKWARCEVCGQPFCCSGEPGWIRRDALPYLAVVLLLGVLALLVWWGDWLPYRTIGWLACFVPILALGILIVYRLRRRDEDWQLDGCGYVVEVFEKRPVGDIHGETGWQSEPTRRYFCRNCGVR